MATKKKKPSKKKMKELGANGGAATLKKYGSAHFSKIKKEWWEKQRARKSS